MPFSRAGWMPCPGANDVPEVPRTGEAEKRGERPKVVAFPCAGTAQGHAETAHCRQDGKRAGASPRRGRNLERLFALPCRKEAASKKVRSDFLVIRRRSFYNTRGDMAVPPR